METYEINFDTGERMFEIYIAGQKLSFNIAAHNFELHETPTSYREAFSKIIWDKINLGISKRPSVEEIASQDDAWFLSIFSQFFKDDPLLKEKFDLLDNYDDICERFEKAYLNRIISISSISEAITKMQKSLDTFATYIKASITSIFENIDFDAIIDTLTESVKCLDTPNISDDEKDKLIASYKSWGHYLCTKPLNASEDCFSMPPKDLKEAEKFILQHCDDSAMEELFDVLCKKRDNNREISEAIICYKHNHKTACASILFSVIDSCLIRLQEKRTANMVTENTAKRKVGYKAKELFEKQVEEKFENSTSLYVLLSYTNIFECLNSIFCDTNDFTLDSKIINRHMQLHGMSIHSVRKIDCIKLFLLLYNLIDRIELFKTYRKGVLSCPT